MAFNGTRTQQDPVDTFFVNAVREFNFMTARSAQRHNKPWSHNDKAAGLILVAALTHGPQYAICVEGMDELRVGLIHDCVATAYVLTPEVHGKLPEPFVYDDNSTAPTLTEQDGWDERVAKAEIIVRQRNERRAARQNQNRGPRPCAVGVQSSDREQTTAEASG